VANNSQFLGCVLNPKTNLPCPVYKEKMRTVDVFDPLLEDKEGLGYFDNGDHGANYSASEKSGFPRVHTPTGVKTRKAGYGTVLYTGLCLAAKLEDAGHLKIATQVAGAGISSNENRSNAAEAWWSAAKNEFDLAYSVDVGGVEETEDFNESYHSGTETGRRVVKAVREILAARDALPEGDLDIDSVIVSGTVAKEGSGEADVYPYDRSHGCLGAASMVPFWFVSEAYDGSDHLWIYGEKLTDEYDISRPQRADHLEIFDDVFGCMVLTGDVHPDLVRFIQKVAVAAGKKKLFEEVMLVSMLGKKLEEVGETAYATDSLYEGLRPFRMNPEDPAVRAAVASLTKKERIAVERRAERVRALGLDKLADFDL